MSSERDSRCLRPDGLTKAGYRTAASAKKASRRANVSPLLNRQKGKIVAYRCSECGLYHIGHTLYRGRERNPE